MRLDRDKEWWAEQVARIGKHRSASRDLTRKAQTGLAQALEELGPRETCEELREEAEELYQAALEKRRSQKVPPATD